MSLSGTSYFSFCRLLTTSADVDGVAVITSEVPEVQNVVPSVFYVACNSVTTQALEISSVSYHFRASFWKSLKCFLFMICFWLWIFFGHRFFNLCAKDKKKKFFCIWKLSGTERNF